ncbi:hypothetical protein ACKGJN_15580 [Gillisia sp. Q332]|uniref:hypothetical protein n=1 Tax=Gillisia xinjiangensis TaxID=3384765 RepID=UPI00391CE36D
MKAAINLLLLILFLSINSCSKQDNCENPVDCLPPVTQTGANIAGCLVNGEILLPSGKSLGSGSVLHSQYVYYQNEYIFSITIRDRDNNRLVQVRSGNIKLAEGEKYTLIEESDSNFSGVYIIGGAGSGIGYLTTQQESGEFEIIKLDESKNIISGTFWFDAINNDGEIVQVREGRFDVQYQQ